MSNEHALTVLGQHLHQDIDADARTAADSVGQMLRMMQPQEREDLRIYLASALERLSPSELKGHLNRASENWRFSSKGADRFLRMVAEQLAVER